MSLEYVAVKNESLIIDVRHQLPWQKRYFSTTTTLMLWLCWLLLWQPVMNELGLLDTQSDRLVDQILHAFWKILEHGSVAILICAVMLWLWSNFIPAETARHSKVKTMHDYARAFQLDSTEIHAARQQQIVTVHYDQSGKIVKIESMNR